jgi:acrylyl-CoA reductase (NADPH)
MFNAILIDKDDSGYHANLSTLDEAALPLGNVTVEVQWSTLNYKDALAITGQAEPWFVISRWCQV